MQPDGSSVVFLSFFSAIFVSYAASDMRIICYYTNWAIYRQPNIRALYPDHMDPSLCTHIHFAFALINPTTLKLEPSEKHDIHYTDNYNTPLYLRLYKLKRVKSSLKLLIAVGGWTAASEAFNQILTNSSTRAIFIQQTKEFLQEWNFDGIDLDWEFPGDTQRGALNNSREEFNILIKEMHDSFHNGSQSFLLTAAVSADPIKVDNGYVVPDFCQHLDYVSVMTYDYFGGWDNVTGINAPLYGTNSLDDENGHWKNVNNSIHYWMASGCPAEKLNLGLALYGRSFTLPNDTSSVSVGTESIGNGLAGPYTKENGTLAYFEICQKLRTYNWTHVFDTEAQAPYAYGLSVNSSERQWVGYDDLKSITVKVLYAKTLNLGGAMLWTLDQDDHTGAFCGQGPFPFARRVRDLLLGTNKSDEPKLSSSTKTRTKQPVTFVSVQRLTSQKHRSASTSTVNSRVPSIALNSKAFSPSLLLVSLLSLIR